MSDKENRRQRTPEENQQDLARREKRRRQLIDRFREQQRIAHDWINVAELVDWCAYSSAATSVDEEKRARDAAYGRLAKSMLNGEFEQDLLDVRFLAPEMSHWRLRREDIKKAVEPYESGGLVAAKEFWSVCWLPNEAARKWTLRYGYQWPSHFERVPKTTPVAGEPTGNAGDISRNSPKKKRLSPAKPQQEAFIAWAKTKYNDISTINVPVKELAAQYNRDTGLTIHPSTIRRALDRKR